MSKASPLWTLAKRSDKMNPSVIREILKVTERPGIISFAGGLPSPKTFFNQRLIAEVMKDGFLDRHVPTIRALYKSQRDAMLAALKQEFSARDADSTLTWNTPAGGMFLWARLPHGMRAIDLLPIAVEHGVAFVPGMPFYADNGDPRALRLSFVTPSVDEIHRGVAALAKAIGPPSSTPNHEFARFLTFVVNEIKHLA